jgi:hypothetical protein
MRNLLNANHLFFGPFLWSLVLFLLNVWEEPGMHRTLHCTLALLAL